MSEGGYLAVGLVFCFVVILSIILIIHSRFSEMMVDLCQVQKRARFWTITVETWFILYSVTSALTWSPEGTSDRQFFLACITQIKGGLSGASHAIILFSAGLLAFVLLRKRYSETGGKTA